ncbi:MAG: tRNA preQ1(34) S-adenosylmethionine ribosyltransferase-isomerase QueA [Lachnospiraceae bacterium]|nr:tRNA preQ1(34) S-adenosylmethionine ribosyltransferase-isomerase QueA [Lachnospiraceae bacterium]
MSELRRSDYYYDLPGELIAQDPLEDRSSSRLMVVDRNTGKTEHKVFRDITDYLEPGDCLVLNNTRVIPARLLGVREGTGGHVEVLLLKRLTGTDWETLVRPGKSCRPGQKLEFGDGLLKAEVLETVEGGNRIIRFSFDGIFEEVLDKLGEMPLPPYITHKLADPTRYNTVYAKFDGSAAAPTAGLHFTPELLEKIKNKGVSLAYVTLHVGLGTFRPVKEDVITDHKMHTESYEVTQETADIINAAKLAGGRVICVGTTSCRTVESCATPVIETGSVADGCPEFENRYEVRPGSGETDIFIYPGYEFKIMDGLITNFHLPESTLIMLVSAFAGRENVLDAYKEAVSERYRFFSFGDACFFH